MMRSFDYAMHMVLARVISERPDAAAPLGKLARDWRAAVIEAFITAYDEVARRHDLASVREEASGLVELFTLEKLAYELDYEAANRPDWIAVPVGGLIERFGTIG